MYLKRTAGTQIGMFFSTAWKHRSTVNNNAILLDKMDFNEHEKFVVFLGEQFTPQTSIVEKPETNPRTNAGDPTNTV